MCESITDETEANDENNIQILESATNVTLENNSSQNSSKRYNKISNYRVQDSNSHFSFL